MGNIIKVAWQKLDPRMKYLDLFKKGTAEKLRGVTLKQGAAKLFAYKGLDTDRRRGVTKLLKLMNPNKLFSELTVADGIKLHKDALKNDKYKEADRVRAGLGNIVTYLLSGELSNYPSQNSFDKIISDHNKNGAQKMNSAATIVSLKMGEDIGKMRFAKASIDSIKELIPASKSMGRFSALKEEVLNTIRGVAEGEVGTIQPPKSQMDEKEAKIIIQNVRAMFTKRNMAWTIVYNKRSYIFFVIRKEDLKKIRGGK